MKTITEAQYLYLQSRKNAATISYRTKDVSDEEYEELIQYAPEELIHTVTFKDGDNIIKTVTGMNGLSVSVPYVEKEGYDFNGWSINGETPILPVDAITDCDITYIALWIET